MKYYSYKSTLNRLCWLEGTQKMDVNDIGSLLEFSDRGVEWFMSLMPLAFCCCIFWVPLCLTSLICSKSLSMDVWKTHPQGSMKNDEHGSKMRQLPSGKLTKLWKITFFNGKIHYKWPCSIAMLNYQRVFYFCPSLFVRKHPGRMSGSILQIKLVFCDPSGEMTDEPKWNLRLQVAHLGLNLGCV